MVRWPPSSVSLPPQSSSAYSVLSAPNGSLGGCCDVTASRSPTSPPTEVPPPSTRLRHSCLIGSASSCRVSRLAPRVPTVPPRPPSPTFVSVSTCLDCSAPWHTCRNNFTAPSVQRSTRSRLTIAGATWTRRMLHCSRRLMGPLPPPFRIP